jgi:hypothetical protein
MRSRLTVHPMMSRVGVGDAFIPTHPRNPGCRRVEGALCRGQRRVMAINIQLTADSASECFAPTKLFYDRQAETERRAARIPLP